MSLPQRQGTQMLKALADFLRNNKERIVRTHAVLTEDWSPTYGLGDPRSVDIEVVDFDALCLAIDEFSAMFKE